MIKFYYKTTPLEAAKDLSIFQKGFIKWVLGLYKFNDCHDCILNIYHRVEKECKERNCPYLKYPPNAYVPHDPSIFWSLISLPFKVFILLCNLVILIITLIVVSIFGLRITNTECEVIIKEPCLCCGKESISGVRITTGDGWSTSHIGMCKDCCNKYAVIEPADLHDYLQSRDAAKKSLYNNPL